jgi:hypothetical protein
MGPKQKFQRQHRFLNCHPLSPKHGNEQIQNYQQLCNKHAREVKKCKEPLAFTVGVFRKQQQMADVF